MDKPIVGDAADGDPGEEGESVEKPFEEDKKERRLMVPFMERASQDRGAKKEREKIVRDEKNAWWEKQMALYNKTNKSGMLTAEEKERRLKDSQKSK